jgi:hypothetical protein
MLLTNHDDALRVFFCTPTLPCFFECKVALIYRHVSCRNFLSLGLFQPEFHDTDSDLNKGLHRIK